MKELSNRSANFTDSVIRRMTRVANKYGAVNLSQGFPDFDPPKAITDRLARVAGEGPHQYALTWGAKNFRDAIAAKYEHFSGIKVDPESEIVVTCGSTEAMMATMLSITNPGDKVVYLTFDDGPSENTGEILDILKEKNAKATFFVTGNNQEHDDMIKRAFSEGHSIGLHTYTHDYATVYASEDAYFADLQKVSDLVESITGTKSMIIRFPGGSSNTVSAKYVKGLMTTLTKAVRDKGYQYFDWNCDSTDASGNNVPVEKLVSNATSCTANHVDILMHDTDAKDTTVQALPQIIDYYRSQGYTFKGLTVDSVAAHHGVNN